MAQNSQASTLLLIRTFPQIAEIRVPPIVQYMYCCRGDILKLGVLTILHIELFNQFRTNCLHQKWMATCHTYNLFYHLLTKNLLARKSGNGVQNKMASFCWLQETHF